MPPSLRHAALRCLLQADPLAKCLAVQTLAATRPELDTDAVLTPPEGLPGRPVRPRLVNPRELPARSPHTAQGLQGLLHAVAHIEFNAINLALDAVWRFPGMPPAYYHDWLGVAADEAIHFGLLRDHLRELGSDYGAFDAHDGLWAMAERTGHDLLARLALVPRVLEARGLDATPAMQARLRQVGASRAVAILERILADEITHVAIGNRWYHWACARAALDPVTHFAAVQAHYRAPRPSGPLNLSARRAAGFSDAELARLQADAVRP